MTCKQCVYSDSCSTAKPQGIAARLDGEFKWDNPYHPHTSGQGQSWELGWLGQDKELSIIAERDEALKCLGRIKELVCREL